MKLPTSCTYVVLIALVACHNDPMAPLLRANDRISDMHFLSYRYRALWPNPVGTIDTLSGTVAFRPRTNRYLPYDYVGTSKAYDIVYIADKYQQINHQDSVVITFSDEEIEKRPSIVSENMILMSSPVTLLKRKDWSHRQDTVIAGNPVANYRLVEMDTTIEGNKIYVELHMFIDVSTALLSRYQRRAFLNGKSSQTITYDFTDYEFTNAKNLIYPMQRGYVTKMNGDQYDREPLNAGQPAPDFNVTDIDGNKVNLKSLRGRKVLLDFSVINCGYCKLAIEHLNREGYKLPDHVAGIYINPEDTKSRVLDYRSKLPIPFPAVAGEKSVADAYGVSAFPTFFLIDEKGVIEKVVVGYRPEFVQSLTAITAK